ncbi:MAG: ABC transporter permease [Rhodothermia bacterium]|nr:MAG: ABC transporter permease [Rhodothermia bacterium]
MAALIVVLSVLNGFFDFVRDMLVSFDPHVRIVSTSERGILGVDSLVGLASAMPSVKYVAPYVEGKALLRHKGGSDVNKVVIVRGVDQTNLSEDAGVVAGIVFGGFDLSNKDGRPGVVLGQRLGERLLLAPGGGGQEASRVALLSAPALERTFTRVLSGFPFRQFEVRGLFQLEAVYDESHVFIDLAEAQRLFRMGAYVSGLDLRLNDLERASEVKEMLSERLNPAEFTVLTWYDLQKSLYDVMRLEKWGASLVLILIVIVAVLNIVGSLTMIVIEKRRDVGALRAMGVSRKDVRRIFLIEGLLIGALGSGIGLVLGVGLALAQKKFALVPLAGAESFLIDAYPVSIQTFDVAVISLVALGLCVTAAVYPANRATKIEIAEAVAVEG